MSDKNVFKIAFFFEDKYVLTFVRCICKVLKKGLEIIKLKKQLETEF